LNNENIKSTAKDQNDNKIIHFRMFYISLSRKGYSGFLKLKVTRPLNVMISY